MTRLVFLRPYPLSLCVLRIFTIFKKKKKSDRREIEPAKLNKDVHWPKRWAMIFSLLVHKRKKKDSKEFISSMIYIMTAAMLQWGG